MDFVEEGYYPPELVLLQNTSITLTEMDNMDKERKWLYIYFIQAAKEKEMREYNEKMNDINGVGKGKGNVDIMSFPTNFVAQEREFNQPSDAFIEKEESK